MKTSVDGLINLTALNRVLRYADTVIWGIEDDFHYISDAHMAVKIRIDSLTPLTALVSRFGGDLPPKGGALRSMKQKKGFDTAIVPLDGMKRCLAAYTHAYIFDTRMMYQDDYDRVIRVFSATDADSGKANYIFLSMAFVDCVNADASIAAVEAKRTSPVVFERGDEVAVILPIDMGKPGYLVDLQ